ncbi:RHS repeat-associated core domain-containing protein [Aquimarina sp. RZ0]|uniref:RHS repeat-associated core domain-containing protein n=1 Tax=Aquimarina sp. RZ0 TaxID=2607730 RepID=UPI00165FCB99|nr:RHS repeat-associated core domain-containing protein [Aquimarina sp. RZ0]
MPNRNLQGDYRYAYQGQEKDPETGKEAFEERLWDSRIGRWLTPDPAGKGDSPYVGMYNNPLKYIDIKGRDTLNVYRSRLIGTESGVDQYQLNFEIIKNGKSLKQQLVLYMYANHDYERGPGTGDNALDKRGVYPIKFDQMSAHNGEVNYENTIRLNNAGVFVHPGHPLYNIGCKVVCNAPNYEFGNMWNEQTFNNTVEGLQQIRDLYNTTDQQGFFFITNRIFPVDNISTPTPQGIVPTRYEVITGEPLPYGITN